MTKLQEIVKKARALKKAYPKKYSKWTDYIKAASKSISGYTGTSKSGNKTTVHYTNAKATTKKTTAKQGKLFGTKTHKDTRSHNTNIRVISGINQTYHIVYHTPDDTFGFASFSTLKVANQSWKNIDFSASRRYEQELRKNNGYYVVIQMLKDDKVIKEKMLTKIK